MLPAVPCEAECAAKPDNYPGLRQASLAVFITSVSGHTIPAGQGTTIPRISTSEYLLTVTN
jgi:hypothetical protein